MCCQMITLRLSEARGDIYVRSGRRRVEVLRGNLDRATDGNKQVLGTVRAITMPLDFSWTGKKTSRSSTVDYDVCVGSWGQSALFLSLMGGVILKASPNE